MEVPLEKALDSSQKVVVDLKRKRAENFVVNSPEVTRTVVPLRSTIYPGTNKFDKRIKLSPGSGPLCNKSLVRYYSNFIKSGPPQRLMFYQEGTWVDFSQDIVTLVGNNFQIKKPIIEIESGGHQILLDFLHMIRLDLETGLQQSVAWIDEAGSCFFPEIFSGDRYQKEFGNEGFVNSFGPQEIRLQLEIDINGVDTIQLKESCDESNVIIKDVQETLMKAEGDIPSELNLELSDLNCDMVRTMFHTGMGPSVDFDILEINPASGPFARPRWELFRKQVGILKKCRGNENVQYGWLPARKETASFILMHGFENAVVNINNSVYGIGLHLAALNCCATSAIGTDIDENGDQYMILCRVVLGNTELVFPGSKQFCPSSMHYDNGVDDHQNPSQYIVWKMNINTHIYPEYVVRYKLPFNTRDYYAARNIGQYIVPETSEAIQVPVGLLDPGASLLGESVCQGISGSEVSQGIDVSGHPMSDSNSIKTPKSPWIPFPMLLSAISDKIPIVNMKHVYINYNLFWRKKITREHFVRKVRLLVGDNMLRATIASLQYKIPPSGLVKQERDMEGSSNVRCDVTFMANKGDEV